MSEQDLKKAVKKFIKIMDDILEESDFDMWTILEIEEEIDKLRAAVKNKKEVK